MTRKVRSVRRVWPVVALAGVVLLLLAHSPADAAAGDLDPTFGTGGKVTTRLAFCCEEAHGLVLQPDGKLVAAGFAFGSRSNDFALVRYNADGSLDTTFGAGTGKVLTDFGDDDRAFALVLQPDGKLVMAGAKGQGGDFALARYHADGSLDTGFGAGGKVTTDFGPGPVTPTTGDEAHALVLQPDGKLVAAGWADFRAVAGGGLRFALARYHPNGSLDTSFDGDGKVVTQFAGAAGFQTGEAFALVLQPDGKLVAAGRAVGPALDPAGAGQVDFALARFNPNGSLDTTFDGDGRVMTDFNLGRDEAHALALQPDGKLVAAGFAFRVPGGGGSQDVALVRYNPDGSLDTGFDSDGRVTTRFADTAGSRADALLLQPDGKLVAAGQVSIPGLPDQPDFALARYNPDGSLDAGFGSGGKVNTNVAGFPDHAFALVRQPDGKLVAAGTSANGFSLVRYDGGPVAVATTSTLTSSPNPSTFGQSVTFTDTVCGGGAGSEPTGTVTFEEGATTLGTGTLSPGGGAGCSQAMFSTSSLSVGSHSITAGFPGDATHFGSTSNAVTQVVDKIPTTSTLTSSPNPSTYGESVTFTDTVCGETSGTEPTGTVTFEEGATVLGTGTLAPGGGSGCSQATFSTTAASTAVAPGDVVITNVAQDMDGSFSSDDEFVEISSRTRSPVNLYGWRVVFSVSPNCTRLGELSIGQSHQGTRQILPAQYYLIASQSGAQAAGAGDLRYSDADLIRADGSVTLIDRFGRIIDSLGWGSAASGCREGAAAQQLSKATSLIRKDRESCPEDTNDNQADFVLQAPVVPPKGTGSPGNTCPTPLSIGGHEVTAEYPGDPTHRPSTSNTLTQVVLPIPTTSTLSSSSGPTAPAFVGEPVTFTDVVCGGTFANEPTGEVTFKDGGATIGTGQLTPKLDGPQGCSEAKVTTAFEEGGHSITAEYPGDAIYDRSTSNVHFQRVEKAPTTSTLTSSPNPSTFGESVTFTDTVCGGAIEPTATVTFTEGGTTLGTGTLAPGGGSACSQATFTTDALSAGSHDVIADYPGDAAHLGSTSNPVTQVVNKIPTTPTLTSAPNPSEHGESVTFTDTVCGGSTGNEPSGTVTFREGPTTLGTGSLAAGGGTGCSQASLTTASLTVGSHDVTADYPGDATHLGSSSNTLTQVVNKISTTSTLTSSPNPSDPGQSVVFTDTVCGGAVGNEPAGTVTFEEGPTTLGTATLVPGGGAGCAQATFTTASLSVGSHGITADYAGDTTHDPSTSNAVTQVVNRIPTTSTLTSSPNPSTYGDAVTFIDTVCGGSAGTEPTGTVTFKEGATTLGTGILAAGGGTGCSQTTFSTAALSVGTRTITADYPGDATHAPSSSTVTQVVKRFRSTSTLTSEPNPSTFGETVTFIDTVCGGPKGTEPTGTVTFEEDGLSLGTASLKKGGGKGCATARFTTRSLSAGSHFVTADYPGDADFIGSTSNTVTQLVRFATTSTLTSTPNPSNPGQVVTFTDTVCGGGPGLEPTGTVTFRDGNTPLGTGTLAAGGGAGCSEARFTTSSLSGGSHAVTAGYPGDAFHGPSTSNTVIQVVKFQTTSTITSSVNPSTFGQSVTFTDTVCGGGTGSEPTGTVTFEEPGGILGTATLSPGGGTGCARATFATDSLPAGSYDITARYPGDATHVASTSNTLTQVVNKVATTSTLTSSPNPSTFGQSVTFTDTVCGGGAGHEPTGTVTFSDGSTVLAVVTLGPRGGAGCAQATFTPAHSPWAAMT